MQLIDELRDSRERKQRELELQVTLAAALMEAKVRMQTPKSSLVLRRARDLVLRYQCCGYHRSTFPCCTGFGSPQYLGGEPIAALEQAKEFLSLAQSQAQSGLVLTGHRLVGSALMATRGFPRGLIAPGPGGWHCIGQRSMGRLPSVSGQTSGLLAVCVRAWALWHRGFPDQARKVLDDGSPVRPTCPSTGTPLPMP